MGQMEPAAGQFGQSQIPGHHRILSGRRNAGQAQAGRRPTLGHYAAGAKGMFLAVVDDGPTQIQGVSQRQAHQVGVIDRVAVVAVSHDAGGGQFLDFGQFPAAAALGNAADGKNPHYGVGLGPLLDQFHYRRVVNGRVGVGHTAEGGKAAAGRRPGAGSDGFLILEARFPQVAVQVNEPRRSHQPGGRDNPAVFREVGGGQPGAGRDNAPLPNQDVPYRIHSPTGVNDAGRLKQNQARTGCVKQLVSLASVQFCRQVDGGGFPFHCRDAAPGAELVKQSHPHGHAVSYLFLDDGIAAVGHRRA